jgi:hypothetical protein
MQGRRKHISNNSLAALALLLIFISISNYFVVSNFAKERGLTAADVYGAGDVRLCSSFMPQLTAQKYHHVNEHDYFYYDVNSTGEIDNRIIYQDNTSMFAIDPSRGTISFTPEDKDVGIRNVRISAREIVCNSLTNYTDMTFNITNVNDPPELVSLVLVNDSKGNVTYYFPISGKVELWEDTLYNVSVIAYDPDVAFGDIIYPYVVMWFDAVTDQQIADVFTLNDSTGKVRFMPLQQDVNNYTARFYVLDKAYEQDMQKVDIVIYNVNDPPVLLNKTQLRARTALSGEPFYFDVNATDEDMEPLTYAISAINCSKANLSDTNCSIFPIDPVTGTIDFTPKVADIGNYSLNYTVFDGELYDWVAGNFTIVATINHPPNITDWYPDDYNVTMLEGDSQDFNITVYDPDSGWNTASVRWFIDGNEIIGENGYVYPFAPNGSGIYNLTAEASDGEYADYHQWNVIVLIRPPQPPGGGGRGTTPSFGGCVENWRCTIFSECSRAGLEIRICRDISRCGTNFTKPEEVRSCTYTPNPSCFDNIINCHDGSCEILTDCGGPCAPCPTCSDGIRNCHANGECEEEVDCGGPCKPCPIEPKRPKCGNGICEAGELYECFNDCFEFWLDTAIFVLILILLIALSILLYAYKRETVLLFMYKRLRGE